MLAESTRYKRGLVNIEFTRTVEWDVSREPTGTNKGLGSLELDRVICGTETYAGWGYSLHTGHNSPWTTLATTVLPVI
jgi:hypothetical protein